MGKAKNEDDFTVLRVAKKTVPKLRKLNARIIDINNGAKEPMYITLDNLIESELSKHTKRK